MKGWTSPTRRTSRTSITRISSLRRTNQLYLGWTSDGEWCNYTVNVKVKGKYTITALYSGAASTINFSVG